jgi:hypothetical protein
MISNLIKNFNRKEVNVGTYLTFKSSTPMTITPNYTNTDGSYDSVGFRVSLF